MTVRFCELIKEAEGEWCPKFKPWDLVGNSSWRRKAKGTFLTKARQGPD